MPIRAVIFDFGGVILTSPFDAFARYEADNALPAGFLRQLNATGTAGARWQDRLQPLLYDHEQTVARMAPPLAWYCNDPARTAVARDVPVETPPMPSRAEPRLSCVANLVGCALADIGSPAYVDYQLRLQDARIRLIATATLLWLRDHADYHLGVLFSDYGPFARSSATSEHGQPLPCDPAPPGLFRSAP